MALPQSYSEMQSQRVLIASSREGFRRHCLSEQRSDATIGEAWGGADVLAKLACESWDQVLLDRRLHDLDVGEVVRMIHSRHPGLSVHVLDLDADPAGRFRETLAITAEECAWTGANETNCRSNLSGSIEPLPGMIGSSQALAEVFHLARLVAKRQTTVLITGETGTGKELVAHGIHEVSSRAKGPFVVVNCAAIPEALLEAELFGHARGAFTGAVQSRLGRIHVAHGGTLFLDEIGELPLGMQAKLLRFLQDGEVQRLGSSDVFRVDVRVISATNQHLLECVKDKRFRQDLYYRLAVFPIELPPLRGRKEEIPALAEHFMKELCKQAGTARKSFSHAAMTTLCEHPWPGNVRELQHAIERAFILADDELQLRPAHFAAGGCGAPLREI
jgi:transcriptional regulator with GAF, ATPase, and Fis domain